MDAGASQRLLRLGTSSWTARGWETAFYPPGLAQNQWIEEYARHFAVAEVDSTFYGWGSPKLLLLTMHENLLALISPVATQ